MIEEGAPILQSTREFNLIFIHSSLDDAGLDPFEFRVYAHLARRGAIEGNAFAGLRSIAKICKMNKDTANKAVLELMARKMIKRTLIRKQPTYYLTPPSQWVSPETGHPTVRNEGTPSVRPEGTKGNPIKEIPPKAPRGGGVCESESKRMIGFDSFWSEYPKKANRGTAERAWVRKNCCAILDEILLAIDEHRQSRKWKAGYIPDPGTWLNAKAWLDVISDHEQPKTDPRNTSKGTSRNAGTANAAIEEQYSRLR